MIRVHFGQYSFARTAWKATRAVLLFLVAALVWALWMWLCSFFVTSKASVAQYPVIVWLLEAARDWWQHRQE